MTVEGSSVAFFLPTLAGGGAERVVLDLARRFAGRGARVHLVVGARTGELANGVAPEVQLYVLDAKRTALCIPALAGFLRKERPEVLYSALNHANVVSAVATSVSKCATRLVVVEHTQLSQHAAAATNFRDRFMPKLVRVAYRRAHAIVAVSNGVAHDLAGICSLEESEITVIPNPVDVQALQGYAECLPTHAWFREFPRPVVAVGRLEPEKGFDVLIRAVSRAARSDNERRLVLLGEGSQRAALESLADQEHVQLYAPGFVSFPQGYIRHGSMLVMSSRWEGLPMVLLEALAIGVPVVATDCESGPREILQGRLGTLVPVDDVFAIASAIQAVRDGSGPALDPRLPPEYSIDRVVTAYARVGGVID